MEPLPLGAQCLAAKFPRSAEPKEPSYHPLVCHMLDVAAVVLALWNELPTKMRQRLADGLGLDDREAQWWVAFVAGLHDLGKASGPFQAKDSRAAARLDGTGLAPINLSDPGHGYATTTFLADQLVALGLKIPAARRFATITGGHHGRFLQRRDGIEAELGELSPAIHGEWQRARVGLFDALYELLGISAVPTRVLPNAEAMALAGLITVSDWIGSDETSFPFSPEAVSDLPGYFAEAQKLAANALSAIHWAIPASSAQHSGFEELFGFSSPRPLQEQALAFEPGAAPGLVIIESPMGEGKTEAALIYAAHWERSGYRGMYIGMPTQATANQLHRRVKAFLERRLPGSDVALSLAHGNAWLREDLARLSSEPSGIADDEGEQEGTVGAAEWFTSAKRSLLSPYGVGTIDQSLLSVLQVKHVFVRLFGLAGKVVILDEVHAYDTYMTGLIERLLEWLAALGSPVVLLSATLPSSRRAQLLRAYDRGLQLSSKSVVELGDVSYPAIIEFDGDAPVVHVPTPSPRSVRTLQLNKLASEEEQEALLQLVRGEFDAGRCIAIICNTVGRAQEAYQLLRDALALAPGEQILLFHSRFRALDRQQIEERCLRMFGPDAKKRPKGYVLIATQVIEQSLDVDFDVMITDPAPIDLLLQRSGRLWRHARPEREGDPVLHIRWPAENGGIPEFDSGSAAVYHPHILLRTWWALRGQESVAIPGDVQDLVDFVYSDEGTVPEGAAPEVAAVWRETWSDLTQRSQKLTALSRQPLVPYPWYLDSEEEFFDSFGTPLLEDRPDAHVTRQARTRYEDLPSVGIVWLTVDDQKAPSNDSTWLAQRAITVTDQWVQQWALQHMPPEKWGSRPVLRHFRLVTPTGASVSISGLGTLSLDPELGLLISYQRKGPRSD